MSKLYLMPIGEGDPTIQNVQHQEVRTITIRPSHTFEVTSSGLAPYNSSSAELVRPVNTALARRAIIDSGLGLNPSLENTDGEKKPLVDRTTEQGLPYPPGVPFN